MTALTLEQIAELANVSRSTVSRVVNNHPNVRPSVRDRVMRVIEEQGYAPNAAARSLASQRSSVLGLLIPRSAAFTFSDPFFSHVIQGIQSECHSRGYFLMLSMLAAEMEQSFYQRIVRSRHFDGVLMLSSDIDDPLLPLLIKDRYPLVLIGRHPYFDDVAWVDVDNRDGARQATEHLLALGHQRIATITGTLQQAVAISRRDGYRQALLAAGQQPQPELIAEGDFTQEGGRQAMVRLLGATLRPTAVFVASDTMALGALQALDEAGLRVPEDIALVGFDDLPGSASSTPPLTTVHQPVADLGSAAADLLISAIERQERPEEHRRLPTSLVVRRSSGAS